MFCLFCCQKKKQTKFTGVYVDKSGSKYNTGFSHEKKAYRCGRFLNELEAAQAVNAKCVELNIPMKNPEVGLPESKPLPEVTFISERDP